MLSPDTISVMTMMLGVGVFLGGLFASADTRIVWKVSMYVMLAGLLLMLGGLLWWDFLGHVNPPFQVVIE